MHRLVRDPVFFDLDELAAALSHLLDIELRNSQLLVGVVHPLKVLVTSEHDDAIVHSSVGLCSFEALNCIM